MGLALEMRLFNVLCIVQRLDHCSFGHFRRHQDQGNLNRMTWDEEFGHSMYQGGLDGEIVY